ncbi:MAG: kinase/pyrophosphorylase [Acidobacteria bacterium]|nr:kinase/pyrophosphorylase [Acidobacteriota bacterium]
MADDLIVHIVSDSTGDTAMTMVNAVGVQFKRDQIYIRRHYNIRTNPQVDMVLRHVAREPGLVIFTMANAQIGSYLSKLCRDLDITCVDLLAPLFELFSKHFGERDERVGAFHAVNDAYFRRIEAIEFTLGHDDNQSVPTLDHADVVLVGVSRTSKTPVSMYLAIQHGLKVANIALAVGLDPPAELTRVSPNKVVGLTIQPGRLVEIRRSRLGKLDARGNSSYADESHVFQEIEMAERMFKKNPIWPVIDVSDRSIEETATLILDKIYGRVRPIKSN